MLNELLTNETITVSETLNSWEEAVEKGGELLENVGGVNQEYTLAMKESIKENGPYIVIAPSIALLHARPEDGVKKVCMSLQVVHEGVKFGHPERDPVKLIFAFGALDSKSHLSALQNLMELLNNKNLLEKVKKAESSSEVTSLITSFL